MGIDLTKTYGYGSGYGSGSGYGYGSGSKEYFEAALNAFAGRRGEQICADGGVLAFWKSGADGTPSNGGKGPARHEGMVEEIPGPLRLCSRDALHATLNPCKWKGERLWVVALYPPVEEDTDKLGSLKREIICEVKPNPFDPQP